MPNNQKKGSKASGKLHLNKQTIKDLSLKGDKAGKLRGGETTITSSSACGTEQCSIACANKLMV
jgi:hypothetical protein